MIWPVRGRDRSPHTQDLTICKAVRDEIDRPPSKKAQVIDIAKRLDAAWTVSRIARARESGGHCGGLQ